MGNSFAFNIRMHKNENKLKKNTGRLFRGNILAIKTNLNIIGLLKSIAPLFMQYNASFEGRVLLFKDMVTFCESDNSFFKT